MGGLDRLTCWYPFERLRHVVVINTRMQVVKNETGTAPENFRGDVPDASKGEK